MINLTVTKGANGDYYDSIIDNIRTMSVIACGGYYEPLSDRDAEIGKVLYNITHPEVQTNDHVDGSKWYFSFDNMNGRFIAIDRKGTKYALDTNSLGEPVTRGLKFDKLFNAMCLDLANNPKFY